MALVPPGPRLPPRQLAHSLIRGGDPGAHPAKVRAEGARLRSRGAVPSQRHRCGWVFVL